MNKKWLFSTILFLILLISFVSAETNYYLPKCLEPKVTCDRISTLINEGIATGNPENCEKISSENLNALAQNPWTIGNITHGSQDWKSYCYGAIIANFPTSELCNGIGQKYIFCTILKTSGNGCSELELSKQKSQCFVNLAGKTKDSSYCNEMTTDSWKLECYQAAGNAKQEQYYSSKINLKQNIDEFFEVIVFLSLVISPYLSLAFFIITLILSVYSYKNWEVIKYKRLMITLLVIFALLTILFLGIYIDLLIHPLRD